jgi:hypothetical protein
MAETSGAVESEAIGCPLAGVEPLAWGGRRAVDDLCVA